MKTFILYFLLITTSATIHAQHLQTHEATPLELKTLEAQSSYYKTKIYTESSPSWQPSIDTADFKYVLMTADSDFVEAEILRETIAKNLPQDVKLVLLVNPNYLDSAKEKYAQFISLDRVIFATASDSHNGFWARDAFPYPVITHEGKLSLVSANYYRPFKGGQAIANSVSTKMTKFDFTFVGGNLLADENGVCFAVNSRRLFNTTAADLTHAYGCKSIHLLEHLSGIGDVDEVIKPLGKGLMITNTPAYVKILNNLGYQTILIPEIPDSYRTYVNSLIVGKTVFMPSYGIPSDQQATAVYESLGYKVVPIKSNQLSDDYHGSVHCQTMAFPDTDVEDLLFKLKLTQIK